MAALGDHLTTQPRGGKHTKNLAQAKLGSALAFEVSIYLSLSDAPNPDLNNPTNLLIKSTLVQLVYSSKGNTVNIKE